MLLEIKELSPKTVRDVLTILRAVINYSSKQLPDLPIIHFHFPKIFQKEMRVLTPDEQKHLVEYLLSELDDCRLGILLALFTGMRIGELCALRWENVSIKEKSIKICHTVQRLQNNDRGALTRTKLCFGDPKSDKSYRVIPIPDKLICLCKKMMKGDHSSYVLTGSEKPMDPRTLQYRLEKYTRICGIEGIHFHTLRHSFATRCIEVGFELKCLSEVLGHASTSITLDRYVHSSWELKRTNMNKLPFPAP